MESVVPSQMVRLMDNNSAHVKDLSIPFKQPSANQNTLNFPTGEPDIAWPAWPTGWAPNNEKRPAAPLAPPAPAAVSTMPLVSAPEKMAAAPAEPKSKKEKKAANNKRFEVTAAGGIDPIKADKMRRVDWRWAAAKGYLNKDTNEWNEEMGGMKAYLAQRNQRMITRKTKAAEAQGVRQRKEALRAKAIRTALHLYVDYERPAWTSPYQQQPAELGAGAMPKVSVGGVPQQHGVSRPQQMMDANNNGGQVQQQQQQQQGALPLYFPINNLQQMPVNNLQQQQQGGGMSLQQQLINRGIAGGQQSGSTFQVCNNNGGNSIADQGSFVDVGMSMNSWQPPAPQQQPQQPQQQNIAQNIGQPAPISRSMSAPTMQSMTGGGLGGGFMGANMTMPGSMSFDGAMPQGMNESFSGIPQQQQQPQQQLMQQGSGSGVMQNQAQIQMLQQQLGQRGWGMN